MLLVPSRACGCGVCRLGDVCVSPFAVNWDCRLASWTQTAKAYPNQCTFPEHFEGPFATCLFGQCVFTNIPAGSLALSDELIRAARATANRQFPRRYVRVKSSIGWGVQAFQVWVRKPLAFLVAV